MILSGQRLVARSRRASYTPTALLQGGNTPTQTLVSQVERLKLAAAPSQQQVVSHAPPVAEQLYDALVAAKIRTAQVASHLQRDWRQRLFRQLDALHDPEDWLAGDLPVLDGSFAAFLRAMLLIKPRKRPGLALTAAGHLLAGWTEGPDRLTLEFLPTGSVRWALSCRIDEDQERAAGETAIERLPVVLQPYEPARWFGEPNADPA